MSDHDPKDWRHCTACRPCNDERKANWVPQTVYIGTVPGGANDSAEHQWHMKGFDKEMTKYKGAIDNGLNPSTITLAGVEAAERGYDHIDQMKMDDRLGDRKDEKRNARARQQLANEGIEV